MTLVDEAVRAENISDAFSKYRKPNPDAVQNINAAIAQLAGLSWALREIDTLLEDHGYNLYLIEEDLKEVHEKVSFTLADIWHIIGTIAEKPNITLTDEHFRKNWKRIVRYCKEQRGQDLIACIDTYKRFLHALCTKLQSPERDEIGALRRGIQGNPGGSPPKAVENAEKDTSGAKRALTAPAGNGLKARRSYERHRRGGALSPTESDDSSVRSGLPPVDLLSPPTSPTNTFSTASQVSSVEHDVEHWALQVFRDIQSGTPLPLSSEKSEYHDAPGQPSYSEPGGSFEEVVALSFPPDPPGLRASLFYRRRDWRSRLVARWKDAAGKQNLVCLPLNSLQVFRKGAMLHFGRPLADRRTNFLWLSLKFTTMERLVLFACTFLSMRARDGKRPVKPFEDWGFEGEVMEFAGKIQDNGFSHGLRIYRDEVSRGIRLQASAHGGPLDNTPVWTAFVTHYITSKTWCRRLDRNIVCLQELRPHKFCNDYEFQRLPDGAFVLNFESRDDAVEFVALIERLGRVYRKG